MWPSSVPEESESLLTTDMQGLVGYSVCSAVICFFSFFLCSPSAVKGIALPVSRPVAVRWAARTTSVLPHAILVRTSITLTSALAILVRTGLI